MDYADYVDAGGLFWADAEVTSRPTIVVGVDSGLGVVLGFAGGDTGCSGDGWGFPCSAEEMPVSTV